MRQGKLALLIIIIICGGETFAGGEHYTKGHFTRYGGYVSGHYSTDPDHDRYNNYSSRGNFNPNTGKSGTKSTSPFSTHITSSGPNGGQYYINSRGRKTYVSH